MPRRKKGYVVPIVTAIIVNEFGEPLMVRAKPRDSERKKIQFAGGKLELKARGPFTLLESPIEGLRRELREELGTKFRVLHIEPWRWFIGPTPNRPYEGASLACLVTIKGVVMPSGESGELFFPDVLFDWEVSPLTWQIYNVLRAEQFVRAVRFSGPTLFDRPWCSRIDAPPGWEQPWREWWSRRGS